MNRFLLYAATATALFVSSEGFAQSADQTNESGGSGMTAGDGAAGTDSGSGVAPITGQEGSDAPEGADAAAPATTGAAACDSNAEQPCPPAAGSDETADNPGDGGDSAGQTDAAGASQTGGGEGQDGSAAASEESDTSADGGAEPAQNAAAPPAEIAPAQRVIIRERIVEKRYDPVVDIDFQINIGVSIPQTVVLHPLPPEVITIVPAYEGYRFFILADGTIVIVHPVDYVIVYVISV